MEFRAKLQAQKFPFQIAHTSPILFVGSCFSSNMALRCENSGFEVISNPFGTVFNPISLATSIERIARNVHFEKDELNAYNGKYFSFLHHSLFSNTDATLVLQNINTSLTAAHQLLQQQPTVFITLGTAWIYELEATGQCVANCHKLPQNHFHKRILSPIEVENSLSQIVASIQEISPQSQIVFTVSPVRHLRDGMAENNRSKGVLLAAVHNFLDKNAQLNCHYFPVYEWVIDELRDYRFFENDFMHPNQLAIDFVFEQFEYSFFSSETRALSHQVNKLTKAKAHRPLRDGVGLTTFAESMIREIERMQLAHPYLKLHPYTQHFKALLTT